MAREGGSGAARCVCGGGEVENAPPFSKNHIRVEMLTGGRKVVSTHKLGLTSGEPYPTLAIYGICFARRQIIHTHTHARARTHTHTHSHMHTHTHTHTHVHTHTHTHTHSI